MLPAIDLPQIRGRAHDTNRPALDIKALNLSALSFDKLRTNVICDVRSW